MSSPGRCGFLACVKGIPSSILVKLSSLFLRIVCSRGKSKAGLTWGKPRFSTFDANLGAELWYRWEDASFNVASAVQFAHVDSDGLPVKAGVAAVVFSFLLSKRRFSNPELFTVRRLRRKNPTMIGQRFPP